MVIRDVVVVAVIGTIQRIGLGFMIILQGTEQEGMNTMVEAKTRNGTGGGTAERGDGTASNC